MIMRTFAQVSIANQLQDCICLYLELLPPLKNGLQVFQGFLSLDFGRFNE